MSSRTSLFHRLRSIINVASEADRAGLSTTDAIAEAKASDEASSGLSRRDLLKGAGVVAAGTLAARIMAPRKAWAAKGGNKPTAPDVAIIGAGLAGLTCADQLLKAGVAPTLYEASNRAGGRIYSRGLSFDGPGALPGQVIELGGEFIDTTHLTMRAYANEFGFAREDVKTNPGEETYFVNGQHYSMAEIVDAWRDLVPALRTELRRSSGGPTADSYSAYDVGLDNTSLAQLLDTHCHNAALRGVLEAAYVGEYGAELANQSAFNLLLFMHLDNRSKFKPFGVFSDERFHLVGGNEQIPRALATRLDSFIEYGAWLKKVEKLSSGRYRVHFQNSDGVRNWGSTWSSDHDAIVLAVPFSVLRGVELHASLGLPAWKTHAINNFSYGASTKLMMSFNRPTWHDHHKSGAGFVFGLPNTMNTWETNDANSSASRAVLTSFTGGNLARRLDPSKPGAEAAKFLAEMEAVWPGVQRDIRRDNSGLPVATLRNWSQVPTALGGYTNNAPGYFTTIAGNEAKPVGKLFFAGEHTDSFYAWQGFMEGAA